MDTRKRTRDDDATAAGAGAASGTSGAAAPSRGELLALLAARDADIAARDAQLAALQAAGGAALAAARAERDAALATAVSASATAEAERAFTRALLARDATLAAALRERDEGRARMAQPSVRLALLGERLLDVIPLVSAVGYAADVSQCLYLCGTTYRAGDKGATNDMLVRSQELQCGARAARAAGREDFRHPTGGWMLSGTTQLIRAAVLNNLQRVLQLVQLGAPLDFVDKDHKYSALHWACELGHEAVATALLDGKYEGRGADFNLLSGDWTPLMLASANGQEGDVRLLLARGAKVELQDKSGWTALHFAADRGQASVLKLLCAAPGAADALALRDREGRTPLAYAVHFDRAACADVLRAHGAPSL